MKNFIIAISLFLLLIINNCQAKPNNFHKITIKNQPIINGIYDPSIEYDKNGIGWLVYSDVNIKTGIKLNIAKSVDRGQTWKYKKHKGPEYKS